MTHWPPTPLFCRGRARLRLRSNPLKRLQATHPLVLHSPSPRGYIYFANTLRTFSSLANVLKCVYTTRMTKRRQLVLDFIRTYMKQHGVSPSYEVVAKGLGMSSKSNIHRIVHCLKQDGHLELKPYKFHSIKLVDQSAKMMAKL